jgi:hypothetical protein
LALVRSGILAGIADTKEPATTAPVTVDEWAFLYREGGMIKKRSLAVDEPLEITDLD